MGYVKKVTQPKMVCKNPKCDKYGRLQPMNNFYKANNSATPYYPICKKCVESNIDVNNLQEVQDFSMEKNLLKRTMIKVGEFIEDYLYQIMEQR